MWHEARKQEKKIRGLLVDYRKRAERRQDFYERIKADPTQFMQVHGRKSKIYLDPSIALAAENQAIMMPWQGQKDNLIDRFDVRAHLDYIPPVVKTCDNQDEELSVEERQINYERYRVLAQNEFLGINEEKFLYQLALEEQFGVNAQVEAELKASSSSKKKSSNTGVAIGYTYEENESQTVPFSQTISNIEATAASSKYEDCMKESDYSDLDMDVSIDINKVKNDQAHEMNAAGRHYGMKSNDFYSFLTKDSDEADALRLAKEQEQEKIMFSGRKSRRERRAQRERRFAGRPTSPPSYAAKEELVPRVLAENDSSRSPSPDNSGKITYITSFGGEDELQQPHSKISINLAKSNQGAGSKQMSYADKVKQNLEKLKSMNQDAGDRKPAQYKRYSSSRSRSRSRSRNRMRGRNNYGSRRRRSTSRSRRRRYRSYSRSRSASSKSPRKRTRTRRSSSSSYSSKSPRKRRSSSSSSTSSSRSRTPIKRRTYSSESSSVSPQKMPKKVVSVEEKKPLPIETVPLIVPSVKLEPVETVTPVEIPTIIQPEPEVPIKRYYGRKRDDETSSDALTDEEAENKNKPEIMDTSSNSCPATEFPIKQEKLDLEYSSSRFGKSSIQLPSDTKSSVGGTGSSKLATFNPRDRLKRKMQILLNKQYKADKKAEIEKTERQIQLQQEREDEMRELALKLRRRQRELRHKYGTPESNKSPSKSYSNSEDEEDDEDEEKHVEKLVVSQPPKEVQNKEQSKASTSTVPKSLINQGIVIERKPVLRRFAAEKSKSRSKSRNRRHSRSKSRSRKRSVSRGRDYRSRGYYDRSRRSRERNRSRSRDRYRRTDYKRRSRSRRRTRTRSRDRKDRDRKREESPKTIRKLVDY